MHTNVIFLYGNWCDVKLRSLCTLHFGQMCHISSRLESLKSSCFTIKMFSSTVTSCCKAYLINNPSAAAFGSQSNTLNYCFLTLRQLLRVLVDLGDKEAYFPV